MASNTLMLKLLVYRPQRKVVFAEAESDAVDFLFSMLALPLGEVVRRLTKESMAKESMVGSLGKLYKSLDNLDEAYIQDNQGQSSLLTPRVVSPAFAAGAALTWKNNNNPGVRPPAVEQITATDSGAPGAEGGLVNGSAMYIVMDDLEVVPISTSTIINLLSECGVQDFDSIEEVPVELGIEEALKILKASLQSTTVLSDVFFPKN